ncbi:MAG: hypothetical protein ACXADW_12600 [Candidatus Hodarchaeales archaeon]|jgi:hypothetical protein
MAEVTKKAKTKTKTSKDFIIIRSYPETLFFYPSMLVAILSFFIQSANPSLANELGTFFFAVFAFNFIIVAFDFGIGKTAIIAFGVIILVLIAILLQEQLGTALNLTLPNINVSNDFYFFFSLLMFAHFILVYIYSRIDYWMMVWKRTTCSYRENNP